MFQNKRKRMRRRNWPIHGYTGPNGSGKSAAMVWDTLPSLEAGRQVLSTVRLLDYVNPRECEGCDEVGHDIAVRRSLMPAGLSAQEQLLWLTDTPLEERSEVIGWKVHGHAHPLLVPFRQWGQLLEFKGGDVLMDEVTGVASSRESHSMPAAVANVLVQMRRNDVVIRWTAPAWMRSDKIIREVSQAVTYCKGYMPKVAVDEAGARAWGQRRLFEWKTYDAQLFEDFTSGKREQLKAEQVDWHYGPRSPVFSAYDTLDAVETIGTVSEGGSCERCGGSRPRPKCSCPDFVASLPARRRPAPARRASAEDVGALEQLDQPAPALPVAEHDHAHVAEHAHH